MISDHIDALAVLAVGVLLLAFIELRLRALFTRHESREERMHATSQLAAEGAVSAAREAQRTVEEIRSEVATQRLNVANLSEMLRVHEGRLAAVELRLTRVLVAVPHQHSRDGDSA